MEANPQATTPTPEPASDVTSETASVWTAQLTSGSTTDLTSVLTSDATSDDSSDVTMDLTSRPGSVPPIPSPLDVRKDEREYLGQLVPERPVLQNIGASSYRPERSSRGAVRGSLQNDLANRVQATPLNYPRIDEETYPRNGLQGVRQGIIDPSDALCHHIRKDEAKHPIERTLPGTETDETDTTDDEAPPARGFTPYSNPKAKWGKVPPSQRIRRPRQKDGDRGLMSLSMPVPSMRSNNQDEESIFIAELYVGPSSSSSANMPDR
jgi:hypothetical protein